VRCISFCRQEMDSVAEVEMLDIQVEAIFDGDIGSDELWTGEALCYAAY
jgi:hypothetical protein